MVIMAKSMPLEAKKEKKPMHEVRKDAEGKGYLFRFDKAEKGEEEKKEEIKVKIKKEKKRKK